MVRSVRYNVPGVVYHLISRFVDRDWFIKTDADREIYLRFLGRALSESDWRCIAYAVMSNHIHLGVIAGEQPLGLWIRRVNAAFADWMNRSHGRIGPMFVRGPKDFAVPEERVARLVAYIHNNPVRAGVVSSASESTWTSHAAYVGLAESPRWLHVDEGLARIGHPGRDEFDRWVASEVGDVTDLDLAAFRRKARKRGAIEVATPTWSLYPEVPLVSRPWAHVRIDPREIVATVAAELGVPTIELCSRSRRSEVVAGRRVAVRCGLALGLTGADIAAALGVSQQAASKILRGHDPDARIGAACARVLETVVRQYAGTSLAPAS